MICDSVSGALDPISHIVDTFEQKYYNEILPCLTKVVLRIAEIFPFLDNNFGFALLLICVNCLFIKFFRSIRKFTGYSGLIVWLISNFVNDNMAKPYLGNNGKRYYHYFLFLFYVILFANFLGLFPFFFSLTSQLSVTLFLSVTSWLSILLIGLYLHGFRFFASFFPAKVPFVLSPFLMTIELLSFAVRLASLSLRLFANIVAGHILLDTLAVFYTHINSAATGYDNIGNGFLTYFIWTVFTAVLMFEFLVACLQAYIFVALVIVYINEAVTLHS